MNGPVISCMRKRSLKTEWFDHHCEPLLLCLVLHCRCQIDLNSIGHPVCIDGYCKRGYIYDMLWTLWHWYQLVICLRVHTLMSGCFQAWSDYIYELSKSGVWHTYYPTVEVSLITFLLFFKIAEIFLCSPAFQVAVCTVPVHFLCY